MQDLTLGQMFVLGGCFALFAWCVGQLTASVGMRYSVRHAAPTCVFDVQDGARRLSRGGALVALVCAMAIFAFILRLGAGQLS